MAQRPVRLPTRQREAGWSYSVTRGDGRLLKIYYGKTFYSYISANTYEDAVAAAIRSIDKSALRGDGAAMSLEHLITRLDRADAGR